MNRNDSIIKLNKVLEWDIVIIGGGASGLGIAVDASKRGYKTLLLEKYDFGKGTSSRSTKLIHGGVRYLQNGDITLVIESLKERGILKRNAPHLVQDLSFVIPTYDWWASPFYGIGMKIYDMMAGKLGLGKSVIISKKETEKLIPNVNKKGLRGGVIYHDGQFDDSRMAITLALSANSKNTALLNYCNVDGLIKKNNEIVGLSFSDSINSKKYQVKSKVVINATGVFAEEIIRMDQPKIEKMIQPSQGVHIVLEKKFLKSKHAILIPQTSDGRVLFSVPWKNYVVVGTTDTQIKTAIEEPKPLKEEIDFILNKSPYNKSEILIAGKNFGCGSSREHAPWALLDFGIKCIISSSYADIFYNNCFKNGILPIKINEEKIKEISEYSARKEEIKIDLNEQKIIFGNNEIKFDLDQFKKKCLLEGLDDIALSLEKSEKIESFEKKLKSSKPWIFND